MDGKHCSFRMGRKHIKVTLFTVLILSLFAFPRMAGGSPLVQELEPQEVVATYEGVPAFYAAVNLFGSCDDVMVNSTARLEVWNIGLEGGAQYGEARLYLDFPHFYSDDFDECQLKGKNKAVYYGTFSGGPNGTVTFDRMEIIEGEPDEGGAAGTTMQFINGTEVEMQGENSWSIILTVENPEAFQTQPTSQITPTEGVDCSPDIHLPAGLQPGQILSPSATFYDPEGNEVPPIQHVWFFNGAANNSVVWDGNEMIIELQYTCPNQRGASTTVIFPAYGALPPPQTPLPPDQATGQVVPATPSLQPTPQSDVDMDQVKTGGALVTAGIVGILISSVIGLINIFSPPRVPPLKPPPKNTIPVPDLKKAPSSGRGETSDYKKDSLDDARDAGDWVSKKIETGSEALGEVKDTIEKIPFVNNKTKDIILEPLKEVIDVVDKAKEQVDNTLKPVKQLMNARETAREVVKQYEQNKQFANKIHKNLKGLPEGTRNQITDVSRAIEGAGRLLEKGLNYVPGYSATGGEKTWQVKKSFQEGAKGVAKAMKTIHTTDRIATEMGLSEEYGIRQPIYNDPEYQRLQADLKKKQPQERGWLGRAWDFLVGKPVDPKVLKFR